VALIRRLLAPDGCPWDREQNIESLRRHVLEEAYEVVDAINRGSREELRDELGDLLMHVAFLSELARAEDAFGPDDVVASIIAKLVRRHPHVFGDVAADDSAQVMRNWEQIKATERQQSGKQASMLASLPQALPALARAQRIGEKVARVGFDWPERAGCREKVSEELAELDEAANAGDRERVAEEFGDLLFALVNLARHLGVDAEGALGQSNAKFIQRFEQVEQQVEKEHGGWTPAGTPLPLEQLDEYWEKAKRRLQQKDNKKGNNT